MAVHVGAGYHSVVKEARFNELFEVVCGKTIAFLKSGGSAFDACALAVSLLEVKFVVCKGNNFPFKGRPSN